MRLYLRTYRTVAGNGTYIDGYAGTGEVKVDGKTRLGSARIAIRSRAFRHLHFFELPPNAEALRWNLLRNITTADRLKCKIHEGDFNELLGPLLESGTIPRDKPCFAFLDPNSTQLSWSSVETLARFKGGAGGGLKVELWILLNTYQALSRLMPRVAPPDYDVSPEAAALDRVMGDRSAWWDVYTQRLRPAVLATRYARRLEEVLGYGAARPHPILDPKTGRTQYHMIQASDHKAAFSIMRWAERETSQECFRTPSLFGDDVIAPSGRRS